MVFTLLPHARRNFTMSRKKIVAANWKMNMTLAEGDLLIENIKKGLPDRMDCEVVVAPPALHIVHMIKQLAGSPIQPAAQNCHSAAAGAFTGEISAEMLSSVGVKYCLAGHSERRQIFHESNDFIRQKVDAILEYQMIPIFCCGEALELREKNGQNDFVRGQLEDSLFHLSPEVIEKVVIAYEPIWAIGTGVTASPEQAQEMHAFIRSLLADRYGKEVSDHIRILYGGSIKADNATILFSRPDVDGGLVGGASLDAKGFISIIEAGNIG